MFGGREGRAGMEAAAQEVSVGSDWRPPGGLEGEDWEREAGGSPKSWGRKMMGPTAREGGGTIAEGPGS